MRKVLWVGAFMALTAVPAGADEVQLKDGSVIYGEVQGMDATHIMLKDAHGIDMRIPRAQVVQLRLQEQTQPERPAGAKKGGILSKLFGGEEQEPAPAGVRQMRLSEALTAEAGTLVSIRAYYGRVRASSGLPRPGSIYINDKEREMRVVGRIKGLSTYSTDHWGSEVEVIGWLKGEPGEGRWLQLQSATVLRRVSSPVPVHN